MNYAVEMGSDAMIYISIFINLGSTVQMLIRGMRIQTDTQTRRHTDIQIHRQRHTDSNVIS
jgi:hypothetical protein